MKKSQLFVLILHVIFIGSLYADPGEETKPNIIFIMTDDQGYAPIGAHGHPWIRTPELDKMASQSVRFDRFMMGSTCAPSRAGTDKDGKAMMSYNAGMKGLKGTVDEGGVRVPFFVRWEGTIEQGKTIDTVVSYLDILPTLADFAGVELPATQTFEGKSLKPLISEAPPVWKDRLHFQHVTRWNLGVEPDKFKWKKYSVRNQRFRLVEGVLYDMENDPGQTKEVTAEFPEMVASMTAAYEKFWDDARPLMINDGVPLAEEKPFHVDYYAQEKSTGIPEWQAPTFAWQESYMGSDIPSRTSRKPKKKKP